MGRKKQVKRRIRKQLKEEDEKLEKMHKSGQDMIKYLKGENEKAKLLQQTIQKEQKVLEKQFEVLTSKSEEISRNFSSLQQWVDTKNQEIQKHELADQKCRHRY